ncbi:Protein ULTRAPETALA 2 [Glycine soja]|uniref:Protein ULTRAPETALA 2 n=1 Tax=Glycine soja TaxID=3848 RepID=A0A0B2S8I3_GLYSO|nr:Protein ULTRAPETALA 2 [Glycine soja]
MRILLKGFPSLDLITGDPPRFTSRGENSKNRDRGRTQEYYRRRAELKIILDFKRGEDYIEVLCGATNKKYGDYVGRLKINNEGQYFITCECCPECPLVNVTIEAFKKHALREGSGRWKTNIWVHCEDEDKVPLWKTPLIKYYAHQANVAHVSLYCIQITCDDDEERSSLKASRGCSRSSTCQGCSTCYCEGCIKCGFEDCNCQECRDFMLYAEP